MQQNNENSIQDSSIDVKEIFYVLKRNILAILAVMVVFGLGGYFYTYYCMAPVYQSSAMLIVNATSEQKSSVTNDQMNSAKKLVDVYSIIATSDDVMKMVKEDTGIQTSPAVLASQIACTSVNETQVMKITVKDSDAARSKQILESFLKVAPGIIKEKIDAGSVNIISQASEPSTANAPNRAKNTLVAGVLGAAIVIIISFIRYFMNNTFKTETDIDNMLGIPVLGVIPKIEDHQSSKKGAQA